MPGREFDEFCRSVIAFSLVNIIGYQNHIENSFSQGLMVVTDNTSLLCVLGSRMFFHMKEAGERGVNEGTSYRLKTISQMEFC